jgi:hypothetical protein
VGKVNHSVDVVGKERNFSFEISTGKMNYSVDVDDVKSWSCWRSFAGSRQEKWMTWDIFGKKQ